MCAVKPLCIGVIVCSLAGFAGCDSAPDGQLEARGRLAADEATTSDSPVVLAHSNSAEAFDEAGELTAWASHVVDFSTQYNNLYWSAQEALGPPDTFSYGYPTAWAPAPRNGTREWITVGYEVPVYAHAVTVRETDGNGFLFQVDVVDLDGLPHTVWAGTDPSVPGAPVDLRLDFSPTSFLVAGVRVHVNTDHNTARWEQIDAIALHGTLTSGPDCNSNGLDDALELAAGSASDCNLNDTPDECDPDGDGDGLPDACDACPESDLADTLTVNECETGVANQPVADGCWMSDLLAECAVEAANHGQFVSCVANLTDEWKRAGLLTGQEKGRVQRCAARGFKRCAGRPNSRLERECTNCGNRRGDAGRGQGRKGR